MLFLLVSLFQLPQSSSHVSSGHLVSVSLCFFSTLLLNLHSYCDADWNGNPNDRKIHYGMIFFL